MIRYGRVLPKGRPAYFFAGMPDAPPGPSQRILEAGSETAQTGIFPSVSLALLMLRHVFDGRAVQAREITGFGALGRCVHFPKASAFGCISTLYIRMRPAERVRKTDNPQIFVGCLLLTKETQKHIHTTCGKQFQCQSNSMGTFTGLRLKIVVQVGQCGARGGVAGLYQGLVDIL